MGRQHCTELRIFFYQNGLCIWFMIVSYGRMSEKSPKIFRPSLKWPNNSLDFYRSKVSAFIFTSRDRNINTEWLSGAVCCCCCCCCVCEWSLKLLWIEKLRMALLGGVELSYKGNNCELVIWLFWVELSWGVMSRIRKIIRLLKGKLFWVSGMALLCWVEVRCDEQNKEHY